MKRKEAFFGLHFDLHPNEKDTSLGEDVTEEMIDHLLERVRPDYVQYDCKGHPGYTGYPTEVGWPSPGIRKDSLAVWRRVTRRHGVRLFVHYSGIWDEVAARNRPEWTRHTPEGRPDPDGRMSTFGPYVDELMIPQLKEIVRKYDVDGIWVDGDCWAVRPDYSPPALKAWRKATGLEDPPRSPEDPRWKEWLEFNRRQFERYLKRYLDELHSFKPGLEITSNWMYSSLAPRPVRAPLDFISGDYSPTDSVNAARFEARYIANVGLPWDLMAWGFNRAEGGPHNHKTAEQLKQEASVVLSQGGGFQIYYQPTRAGWIDPWLVEVMADVAGFCRERQEVSQDTEGVPQVALLLSAASFYEGTNELFSASEGLHDPLKGVLHALLESGYSVEVLSEHQLGGRLGEYPAVVLPQTKVLEPDFRRALLDYVKEGGGLLVVGAEAAGLFREELGVEFEGEPVETSSYILSGRAMGALGGIWQSVVPRSARVVGRRFPTYDPRKGGEPAATVVGFGRGRMAAIYGPLGTAYLRSHASQLREFLKEVMKEVFPLPKVELEGPPCVDLSLRRKEEKLLIHLTNTSGMQLAPNYTTPDFVPPVGPLTLRVRLGGRPSSVYPVPEDLPLRSEWRGDLLKVTLPSLHIHAVLVIEP